MAILLVAFTFFIVIYLMNLFIGLLNVEIENYHKKCEIFLLTKAKVFYLIIIIIYLLHIYFNYNYCHFKRLLQKSNYYTCYLIRDIRKNGFQTGCMYNTYKY